MDEKKFEDAVKLRGRYIDGKQAHDGKSLQPDILKMHFMFVCFSSFSSLGVLRTI